jgi:hypothetical protein
MAVRVSNMCSHESYTRQGTQAPWMPVPGSEFHPARILPDGGAGDGDEDPFGEEAVQQAVDLYASYM